MERVPGSPSSLGGHEGALAALVAVLLFVAVAKPWGPTSAKTQITPTPAPTPSATSSSRPVAPHTMLDTALFGPFEPPPEWSIWPAGYFVSVMYIARAPGSGLPVVLASPRPSNVASTPAAGSAWPSMIEVGAEDHLLWLGIDTPQAWSLDTAVLRRINPNGSSRLVPTTLVPSPWGSFFTILTLRSRGTDRGVGVWPAGDYRLELTASPDHVKRTIEVQILTTPEEPEPGAGGQR